MSDQEKKEQEILNQEMSNDEMETVAGGWGQKPAHRSENPHPSKCAFNHGQQECDGSLASKYARPIRNPDGSINCAATVEDGSWCGSDDACYNDEVNYMGLQDCAKAWL